MNKTLQVGKIRDISRISNGMYKYSLGIIGSKSVTSFLSKENKGELINKYVTVEGYVGEYNGYTKIYSTFVKETKLNHVEDFNIID